MGKKAPTTEATAPQTAPVAGEDTLKIAHANEHADLIESPTTIEGWHALMHVFLDTQPPALAGATINTLKGAGVYAEAIKKSRHHFEGEPNDFTKGFGQALSLAHSVIVTMIQHEVRQVIQATENAPPDVKLAALKEAFQTTVKGGMVSIAITHAAQRAYKLKGQIAAMNEAQRDNTDNIVHAYGMPLASMIVAETTVPPGATVN